MLPGGGHLLIMEDGGVEVNFIFLKNTGKGSTLSPSASSPPVLINHSFSHLVLLSTIKGQGRKIIINMYVARKCEFFVFCKKGIHD